MSDIERDNERLGLGATHEYLTDRHEIKALRAEIERLREALENCVWFYQREDESPGEQFERIGYRFYKECGMLRPGKSQAAALQGTPSEAEREVTFKVWIETYKIQARAALKGEENG